jgi:serine protease Do
LAEYYGFDQKKGALVTRVYDGQPAEKGGIRTGDVITAVDGKAIASSRELSSTIAALPVGKKTAIDLVRNGESKTVQVILAKRNDTQLHAGHSAAGEGELGLKLVELTPETATRLGYAKNERGLLVSAVKSGSNAQKAGIQSGDLIKEINHKPVETIEEFTGKMSETSEGDTIQLLIQRKNAGFVVARLTR